MKAPAFVQNLKDPAMKPKLKKLVVGAGALVVVAIAGTIGFRASNGGATHERSKAKSEEVAEQDDDSDSTESPKSQQIQHQKKHVEARHEAHHEPDGLLEKGWAATVQAYEDLQSHADALRRADEENEKLRLENAHLRVLLETARYDNKVKQAELESTKTSSRNRVATWTEDGRTEHTIGYQPPEHLTPDQLYTLAMTYFRAHEDEKAAKIMTVLLRSAENEVGTTTAHTDFKSGENYLLAAIAWYRIENLKMASEFLGRAREVEKTPAMLDQVRLWEALIEERQGNHQKAQEDMRLVLDRNPHSMEASWINPGGAERARRVLAKKKMTHQEGSRGLASEHHD